MRFFSNIGHLPLWILGLRDIPAVPYRFKGLLDTALRLFRRAKETQPARDGLTNRYTIGGVEASASEFLYGVAPGSAPRMAGKVVSIVSGDKRTLPRARAARSNLQKLSLDRPEQFAMSWTNFADVYKDSEPRLEEYAATLTDAAKATEAFWSTIAENGMAYNLLMLKKVRQTDLDDLRARFGRAWSDDWDALADRGLLFFIDLTIFASLPIAMVKGFPRFTPATITLLVQDPESKTLQPVAVRVAAKDDAGAQHFVKDRATSSAWLYALQAAKTSVTVYGIWLGHVYHWHVVTAAMQMTMFNTLNADHGIYKLIAPQSNFLIQFDEVLFLLWGRIAPPTSVDGATGFLRLVNTFAKGRTYFDDDPTTTLRRNGINEADFTRQEAWDAFPTAGRLLDLWHATDVYVRVVVENTYANDALVREDRQIQAWMHAAADPDKGNIRGLPQVDTREKLARVLTSLVYRITVHGSSRLRPSAYPAQAFVANFPPCLQIEAIPSPDADLSTEELLRYLPKTGTIGEMMTFYNTFIFSTPYQPFIPDGGITEDLFWPSRTDDPRNEALIAYRKAVVSLIRTYEPSETKIHQWPMNIET